MEKQTEEEIELRHYLLSELREEERWAVEERLFLDREYLLQLQALEDELVDAYVCGDLTPAEQERVVTELLSKPGRREDLKFAYAFKDYLDADVDEAILSPAANSGLAPQLPRKISFPFLPLFVRHYPVAAFAFAAAALFILALVVWQVSEAGRRKRNAPLVHAPTPSPGQSATGERRPPQGSEEEQASKDGGVEGQPGHPLDTPQPPDKEGGKRVAEQIPPQQQRPHTRPSPPEGQRSSLAVTVLLLPASVVREEGQGKVVHLSPEVGTLNLQLPLFGEDEGYRPYQATLRAGGKTIRSWANLKPVVTESGSLVQVPVPAQLLRRQNYEISLAGVTGNGRVEKLRTYSFEVQGK